MSAATVPPASPGLHELLLVQDAEQAARLIAARARAALAEDQHVLLAVGKGSAEATLDLVGESPRLHISTPPDASARPAHVLDESRDVIRHHRAHQHRLRLLHEAPVMASLVWPEWLRVEAAVAVLFPDVAQTCVYRRGALDPDLESGLRSTHTVVADGETYDANECYLDPVEALSVNLRRPAWITSERVPVRRLAEPRPRDVRAAIASASLDTVLDPVDVEALVLAASEVVSNARIHGAPPVTVAVWVQPRRMVVAITDRGAGPSDPLVGLVDPTEASESGRGWWLVHRLVDVQHTRDADGYTAVLSVGDRDA